MKTKRSKTAVLEELYRIVENINVPVKVRKQAQEEIDKRKLRVQSSELRVEIR